MTGSFVTLEATRQSAGAEAFLRISNSLGVINKVKHNFEVTFLKSNLRRLVHDNVARLKYNVYVSHHSTLYTESETSSCQHSSFQNNLSSELARVAQCFVSSPAPVPTSCAYGEKIGSLLQFKDICLSCSMHDFVQPQPVLSDQTLETVIWALLTPIFPSDA